MGPPLFSPASVFWRVNRELASGLAGPRVAHVPGPGPRTARRAVQLGAGPAATRDEHVSIPE